MTKRVCLIIRDGWGHREDPAGNAVAAAKAPFCRALLNNRPNWTLLEASGEPVGLPDGYQGSSEVGHLNMGAGRIVIQELKRIDDGLKDGSFFNLAKWKELMTAWQSSGGSLHLLGLLQDEGVHAHQEHLYKIMRRAREENPSGQLIIHPFLDGRDTPPRSSEQFLARLEIVMKEVGKVNLGTMMGRYYAMDRSRNYNLTDLSVVALNQALGRPFKGSPINAVKSSWENDRTPDNYDMVDEYIPPLINDGYKGLAEGDCVFHTNFRQDRAIQLTQAFVDPNYPGKKRITSKVKYLGLTRYYDEFTEYLLGPMGGEQGILKLLGEIISKAGLKQLRLAETQKFRHVTSFFNGKSTKPFPLEEQVEIKGRFDPASFASHPEMEAKILNKTFLDKYLGQKNDFIAINYANCDMVGHTGVLEAAIKAVEIVDQCLAEIVPPLLEADYQVLITADHGNAEEMIDHLTGLVKTSHTLSPVELFLLSKDKKTSLKQKKGKLSDLAPSILSLMDLPIPKEMSAENLIIQEK